MKRTRSKKRKNNNNRIKYTEREKTKTKWSNDSSDFIQTKNYSFDGKLSTISSFMCFVCWSVNAQISTWQSHHNSNLFRRKTNERCDQMCAVRLFHTVTAKLWQLPWYAKTEWIHIRSHVNLIRGYAVSATTRLLCFGANNLLNTW